MKKIILLEIILIFLSTTFQGDSPTGWVQQTIPRPDLTVVDIQFRDTLTGFIVQSRFNPDTSFISKTTDGGNNWIATAFTNSYLTSIEFTNDNTGYCSGRSTPNGIIFKTTNSGINWFLVSTISYSSILMDCRFVNSDTGWVCSDDLTSGGLWRTTDGGINWHKQLNNTYKPTRIFFINGNTGWIIGNAGQNLYKTTNCGINWFDVSSFSYTIADVFFASSDTGWVVGGGNKGLKRTINGGINWNDVNIPTYLTSENRLYFIQNAKGWAGSAPYKIFASEDGYNWGIQNSPIWSNYYVWFVDSLNGWAGRSGLVHTNDGGGTIVSTNEHTTEIPKDFILEQNYPNPFNQSTIIRFQCPIAGYIQISIYDILGKEVSVLFNEWKELGKYETGFNGSNFPSGVYFYQLKLNKNPVSIKKMVISK